MCYHSDIKVAKKFNFSSMSKTKVLNLRISPDLKKKAKKVAEEDGRSLSNWVTYLINREVKKAEKAAKTSRSDKDD